MLFWSVWGLVLYQACLYLLKHIYCILVLLSFVVFLPKSWKKDINVFCFYAFQRLQIFLFLCFSKISMSSVLYLQRLQCLLFLCLTKTSMSSVFMLVGDFNVFYFYVFQKLQCLLFLRFSKTSMSYVFMLFGNFNVFYFYAFQRLNCLLFFYAFQRLQY